MDGVQGFTIDQVQKIYLYTKDAAEAMSRRHQEEIAPLNQRLEVCKSWMMKYLTDQGLENAKTEHGQCYKSTIMSAAVDPDGGWDSLLRYVLSAGLERVMLALEGGNPPEDGIRILLEEPALALLNRSVNKTAVKELLEQDVIVPGVKITHVTQLNVRRA